MPAATMNLHAPVPATPSSARSENGPGSPALPTGRSAPEDDILEEVGRIWNAKTNESTLFGMVLETARKYANKVAVEDSERNQVTYKRLILGSLILGAKLVKATDKGEAVGILLPNVTGLVVTVLGLNAHGRVPALLNFTAGPRNVVSAVKTAPARKVVTSRRFVETAKLHHIIDALETATLADGRKIEIVYLEDVRKSIGAPAKALGFLRSLRAKGFHGKSGMAPDKPAVVLFTSGTEGAPKGVVLSNRNLIANSHQIMSHANRYFSDRDTVMNPLPMFHSFGLTAATLMPLFMGMRVILYPSPLHYKQIPQLIRQKQASILFATDTFLQGYARAAADGDLSTLTFVIAGAERVKDITRKLWADRKIDIQEGYGATECAPVLACNLPAMNTPGTVGPLLPGIDYRITPVDGINEGGRLEVRGPNVMLGYLFADHPGVVVPPRDGWHDTGDIVTIDNGKVTIRGRAKRFAKIGGEMVSLAAIEALAASLWPDAQHVAVNIPDQRKGEQLVLVTDKPNADKSALQEFAKTSGFPELWVPKAVMVVGAIPVLGSGKIDVPATTRMVEQARPLL